MVFTPDELPELMAAGHAVIQAAKDSGVYVFSGGIDDSVAPVLVAGDGSVTDETYPETTYLNGGFAIFDVPTRAEAVEWAARIAVACRCSQELREFGDDPEA